MTDFPAHPAWDFVVRLYAAPGVAPACLELQERHGVDVTLMLFCLWLGAERGEDVRPLLPALSATAQAWRESAVQPIRAARRWLKGQGGALYQTVLKAEIDCEHGALLALAEWAAGAQAGGGTGPQALAAYLAEAGVVADEALVSVLAAALSRPESAPSAGTA